MNNNEQLLMIEARLREVRTNDAIKKGYMGMSGKFCVIAKFLGDPLIRQGGLYTDQNYLEDPYATEEDIEEIPIMDEDQASFEIGTHFDGLSRGMNLTINVLIHLREITVYYNGLVVYKEVADELDGYVPSELWEKHIDYLYEFCRKIEKHRKPVERNKLIAQANEKKQKILEELRLKWGL